MTFEAERVAIEKRLEDNWSTTTIAYDNTDFRAGDDNWIRLTILNGDTRQISLGQTPDHRTIGIISIQIFIKKNTGSKVAREYADTLAAIFRNATFGGIVCRSPAIARVGERDGWYQLNLSTPYYRDDTF